MQPLSGDWSVKDVLAHLVTMEHLMEDVLKGFLEGGPTPYMDGLATSRDQYQEEQVQLHKNTLPEALLKDLNETGEKVILMALRIPPETLRQAGSLPWYGEVYDLEDYLIYTHFGHKTEHVAQLDYYFSQRGV
jgi:hypothetical protein